MVRRSSRGPSSRRTWSSTSRSCCCWSSLPSTYERRVGHWRTLLVVIGGQALGVLLTAGFLRIFNDSGWTWAVELGRETDLGISAGGYAVVAALTAVMQPVWRRRVRVGFERLPRRHGPRVRAAVGRRAPRRVDRSAWSPVRSSSAGDPQRPRLDFGPRTQRAIVALIIAVSAVASLIEAAFPGNGGPFHTGGIDREHPTSVTLAGHRHLRHPAPHRRRRAAPRAPRGVGVRDRPLRRSSFVGLFFVEPSAERTADFVLVGGQLVLLLVTYRAFTRAVPTQVVAARRPPARSSSPSCLFAYTAIGFCVLQDEFVPEATPGRHDRRVLQPAGVPARAATSSRRRGRPTGSSRRSVRCGSSRSSSPAVGLIYQSRRPRPDARRRTPGCARCCRKYPSSSIEWMLTWKGNTIWFSTDGETAIGYRIVGSVALCLADPVGPLDDARRRLEGVRRLLLPAAGGSRACSPPATERPTLAPELGWKAVQVAEDGVVAPRAPGVQGQAVAGHPHRHQQGRQAGRPPRGHASGPTPSRWSPTSCGRSAAAWVADKSLPEMGFTLGGLGRGRRPGRSACTWPSTPTRPIEGFTSWMPVSEDGEVRRLDARPDAPARPGLPSGDGVHDRGLGDAVEGGGLPLHQPLGGAAGQGARLAVGQQRPEGAAEAARLPRRHARAVLRVPVAVRVQAQVPAGAAADVPGIPGRDGAGRDRHRRRQGVHARRHLARTGRR